MGGGGHEFLGLKERGSGGAGERGKGMVLVRRAVMAAGRRSPAGCSGLGID